MTAPPDSARKIEDALHAIADGTPVSWRELEDSPADPGQLHGLHLIEDIASVFRAEAGGVDVHRKVLFRWGDLEAESLLGEGSYGEVYRAFDPWLGRHVALKLLRLSDDNGLEEARRLARLRHRNVLCVYGCGVHDDRAGLWSELINGRTLSAAVAADGAFSAEETMLIGRDVAQALSVVHAAGLVHGDVKAENVMRENGGRVVLMDFGAGGDVRLLAHRRLISGTPRYLPPEVLDGAPLSIASDIYALGVMLFLLASGHYPYQATEALALREEQKRGNRPTLPMIRPDIDAALCDLVESCIAIDPAQRPTNAQTLVAKLVGLLHANARQTSRRLPIAALIVATASLIAVFGMLLWPRLLSPAWDSSVQFLRVESGGNVEIAENSTLHIGDHLRLRLRSSIDAYLYVLNEDASGNATVLFPASEDGMHNPLPGGTTLLLPGGENAALAWEVTDSSHEEFLVVAATEAQPELDRELANWDRAHEKDAKTRAVDSVVDIPAPLLHGEHLRHILSELSHDEKRVRVWQYRFLHGT